MSGAKGGLNVEERLIAHGRLDDDEIPLSYGALDLACWTAPHVNLAPYQRHLDMLSTDVRAYIGADTDEPIIAIEAARQILARRYGYSYLEACTGNADHTSLVRTIDRRRGGVETLAILYAHVLSNHISKPELLAFSTRILVGVVAHGERHLIDPLSNGRTVSAHQLRQMANAVGASPQYLSPFELTTLSHRDVLLRIQDAIKAHHLRSAQPEAAIQALEASVLLAPKTPRLWRELGVLYARQDQLNEAMHALERFLTLPGNDTERYTASQLLQELTHRSKGSQKGDL